MKNRYDRTTDILKERMGRGFALLHKEYGKANPYRKEPVSPKNQLFQYSQLTPESLLQARQEFGPEVVDPYIERMEQLRKKYQEGQ